jgi:hypothetical protein
VVVGAGGLSWELPDRLAPLARSLAQGAEVGALRAGRDGQLLVSLNADPVV